MATDYVQLVDNLNIPDYQKDCLLGYLHDVQQSTKYPHFRLILFGSCARGEATESSDIDLCVELDVSEQERKIAEYYFRYDVSKRIPADILVFTPVQLERNKDNIFSVIPWILQEGVVLYER